MAGIARAFGSPRPSRLVSLLLLLSLAWSSLPAGMLRGIPPTLTQVAEATFNGATALRASLPANRAAPTEIVEAREAHSATFRNPDGSRTSVVSLVPMHFRDDAGRWQPIDPAFRESAEGYTVAANALRSVVDRRQAAVALRANNLIVRWQATRLGVDDRVLAQALSDAALATLHGNGRTLRYTGGWSDPTLVEEVVSSPGAIKHLLELAAPPAADGEWLEMHGVLTLPRGAALWASGERRDGPFTTTDPLEVRDVRGRLALELAPPEAFERERPAARVAASYHATPLGDDQWEIAVRTPLAWWHAPERQYPAVIDPMMHVNRTTGGFGFGMAWVENGSGQSGDKLYHPGQITLANWGGAYSYLGLMQFNDMPALIQNKPAQIVKAEVAVLPSLDYLPSYHYEYDSDEPPYKPKDEELARGSRLWWPGLCTGELPPSAADPCGGLSLKDNRLADPSFTWDTKPAAFAPGSPAEIAQGTLKTTSFTSGAVGSETAYDVTAAIKAWYTGPNHGLGPLFGIALSQENCPFPSSKLKLTPSGPGGPYALEGEDEVKHWWKCFRFRIDFGNARLRITYTEVALTNGMVLLNNPRVPSYFKDVFTDTQHVYTLVPSDPTRWRGVAVRAGHTLQPTLPTDIGLFLQMTNPDGSLQTLASSGMSQSKTGFALIDGHAPGVPGLLRASVVPSDLNQPYIADTQRNYAVHYVEATLWPFNGGAPGPTMMTQTLQISSQSLLTLVELSFLQDHEITIRVSAPPTLSVALAYPTAGHVESPYRGSKPGAEGVEADFTKAGGLLVKEFDAPASGSYALAIVNQGPPVGVPGITGNQGVYTVSVGVVACPPGAVWAEKYQQCQPFYRPHPALAPPFNFATPSQTFAGLTIWSEGGFNVFGGGDWCTKETAADALKGGPVIGGMADSRYTIVGQGAVCKIGNVLSTTADSAVGVAFVISANPPGTPERLKRKPKFVYGTMAVYPILPPDETGVVSCGGGRVASCPVLEPVSSGPLKTRKNLDVMEYWRPNYSDSGDGIRTNDHIAFGLGQITTPVRVDAGQPTITMSWQNGWEVGPDKNAVFSYTLAVTVAQTTPFAQPLSVASLQLRQLTAKDGEPSGLYQEIDVTKNPSAPRGYQLFARFAKVTLPSTLGGASKRVASVIQIPGEERRIHPPDPEGAKHCGATTSCLDIRRPEYSWNNGNDLATLGVWELPDTHITGQGNTVMFVRDGRIRVFSADHPEARRRPLDVDAGFSYDTFGATVQVKEGRCTPNGPIVTIIKGTAGMAMPSLGDDGSQGAGVSLAFTLCETELHQAKLALSVKPGAVPVGNSGIGVDLISGEVLIGVDPVTFEEHTTITIKVGFRSMDGAVLTDGLGTVFIDTRGRFDVSAQATMVEVIDASLTIGVSWEPLDVLVLAQITAYGIIFGELKMHAWVGQGWQQKYSWLPDNDDFHFAGRIEGYLLVEEDAIIEYLPPDDITLGVAVAFGEFCQNEPCTQYGWGMSAALDILGYKVGLYADDTGVELILGTDDHLLIDEHGGGSNVVPGDPRRGILGNAPPPIAPAILPPGQYQPLLPPAPGTLKSAAASWPVLPADQKCDKQVTPPHHHVCTFTVPAGSGRALFQAVWQNGDLGVTLITPSNVEITEANAAQYGVAISKTVKYANLLQQLPPISLLAIDPGPITTVPDLPPPANSQYVVGKSVTFVVTPVNGATIPSGAWKLRLTGKWLNPLLANPFLQHNYRLAYAADPPPPGLTWLTPVAPVAPGPDGKVTLGWQAWRGAPGTPLSGPSLPRMELFTVPAAQRPITPTAFVSGTVIAGLLDPTAGTYIWDTSSLAAGEYAVGARLTDHRRGNGPVFIWAPGTIVKGDTTPPPVPQVGPPIVQKDALILTWPRPTKPGQPGYAADLAGYLITYTIPSHTPSLPDLVITRRMLPHAEQEFPTHEQIRLGGLLNDWPKPTSYCVRAYDASGNVSDCVLGSVALRLAERLPGKVTRLRATTVASPDRVRVAWEPPAIGTVAGYFVFYSKSGCLVPNALKTSDGVSPRDAGNVTSFDLTGLVPGQRYLIRVAPYTAGGYVGPPAEVLVTFAHGDPYAPYTLPDLWASAWGVGAANEDPDGDGLTNAEERALGSNPRRADSDRDGYDDGEEAAAGTLPCSRTSRPTGHTKSKLSLAGHVKPFIVAPNAAYHQSFAIDIVNRGGGEMQWAAVASAPWLALSATSGRGEGSLVVSIDPAGVAGLSPGVHTGKVIVSTLPAGQSRGTLAAAPERAEITVTLRVLPPKVYEQFAPAIYLGRPAEAP